jgi:Ca2+-transporting ATPase
MTSWHRSSGEQVLTQLRTNSTTGLEESEATQRLAVHGVNRLSREKSRSNWNIFGAQFRSLMVIILVGAAAASVLLGDFHDALAIAAIVVLNALLGFAQEYRAENALAALRKLSIPTARVRRAGRVRDISSMELVPGDILVLQPGSFVAADCRILECIGLETQEAALTGESQPVHKTTEPIDAPE